MRILLVFSLLLWPSLLLADTSVWKVSKNDQSLYIGGTLHVLAASDYPLPDSFTEAYDAAQTLVFETDLAALATPDFQMSMLGALTYNDGNNLKTSLKADTFKRLQAYCQARGLPLDNFLRFKPALLTITLTMVELQRLGISSAGVDKYFHSQGSKDGKVIGQLETKEQQLQFLSSMGEGQEDQLILSTLDDMDILAEMMSTMKTAWRQGDSEQLLRTAIAPMKADYPQVYKDLLVSRNDSWMPQITAMIDTPETEFILVGALHLIGSDGIIERLAADGYKIEQL